MTQLRVPRPPIYGYPHTRTDHALLSLMNDERALHERSFCDHAWALIGYLENRLECYPGEASRAESRMRSQLGNLASVDRLPHADQPGDQQLEILPATG